MASDPHLLINGYLDGLLSQEQFDELSAWIAQDPEHARTFARCVSLHDRLRNQFRAWAELPREQGRMEAAVKHPQRRLFARWQTIALMASAAAVLVAVLVIFQGISGGSAQAAQAELKRLIEVSESSADRSYLITGLDEGEATGPRKGGRLNKAGKPEPPIDGAILHTRGPGQYVLIRKFGDGTEFIIGSDGKTSWACPPVIVGKKPPPVRISNDPSRFRGTVPGQKHNIPFLDIRTKLDEFRASYELTLLPARSGGAKAETWHGLLAKRRAQAVDGPRSVEFWYVLETGVIQQMRLDGKPAKRSLLIELVAERDLGPGFFEHTAHHGPERLILSADD